MSALEQWYSSGGQQYIIPTLEIKRNSEPSRYYYAGGFENIELTLESGETVTFEASPMVVALTARDNSGNQSLTFGFQNVTTEVLDYVQATQADDEEVTIVYRKYLSGELSQPAENPIVMTAVSASIEDDVAAIKAGHFDIINTQFNRAKYTTAKYPGLRGLT